MRALGKLLQVSILVVTLLAAQRANSDNTPFVGKLKLEPLPPQPGWVRDQTAAPAPDTEPQVEAPATSSVGDISDLNEPIAAIVIEGNREIATAEIQKLIKSRAGQVVSAKQMKEDIRALIATHWFFDVEPHIADSKDGSGKVLVFRVAERPILRKVAFVGNKKISDEELTAATGSPIGGIFDAVNIREPLRKHQAVFSQPQSGASDSLALPLMDVQAFGDELDALHKKIEAHQMNFELLEKALSSVTELHAGSTFDVATNRDACDRIEAYYRREGYAHAVVELQSGASPDDREAVFKIDEGPQVTVAKISLIGNAAFDDGILESIITTKSGNLWQPAGPEISKLEEFYWNLGYFDSKFSRRDIFSEDRSQAIVVYDVAEGQRFDIGRIEFRFLENDHQLSSSKLRDCLRVHKNDAFDQRAINGDIERLLAWYAERGHIFAKVRDDREWLAEGSVSLIFYIDEGSEYESDQMVPRRFSEANARSIESSPTTDAPFSTAEPPGVRDIDRLVFEGVSTHAVEDIRDSLHRDFDIALASHPDRPLSNFLGTLERQLRAGLQYSGFADATVKATTDDQAGRIVVQVTEGRRYRCGNITINGAKKLSSEKLVQSLTTGPKPSRILWKIGKIAPCDDEAPARIRAHLEQQAATAGFLSAKFDVRINHEPQLDQAGLVIDLLDEGLSAIVDRIEISGAQRDSAEELLRYLDFRPGMPFDSGLPDRLRRQLNESARYLTIDVAAMPGQSAAPDLPHEVRTVQIKLREYAQAPKLANDLAPAEQALVKFGKWMDRWSKGEIEEDLIVTGSIAAKMPSAGAAKLMARMVVAPNRGQAISVKANGADGRSTLDLAFAVYPDRLVLAAPLRKAKLVLPNSVGDRLALSAEGYSAGGTSIDQGDMPFRLTVGMGIVSSARPQPSAFEVRTRFSPAFLLSITRNDESQSELRDGLWIIRNEAMNLQIEAANGRPVSLEFHDAAEGWNTAIRAEENALASELQRLEVAFAESAVAYDAASPWKSLCEFLVEGWLDLAYGHGTAADAESLAALRNLVGRWSPPATSELTELWNRPLRNEAEPFCIPALSAGFSADGILRDNSVERKNLVSDLVLPVYRRLVPKTGWLWPAGRNALLRWAIDDPSLLAHLHETIESDQTGPIGEWSLANASRYLNVDLRETAGFAGIKRLAVEQFQRDYRPLLAGDSWLGRWFMSLARAARTLDESEIRALSRLLPADPPYDTALACLNRLIKDPAESLEEAVSAGLDYFWSESLATNVSAELRRHLMDAFHKPPQPHRDDQVRRAGAELEETAEQIPTNAGWDENPFGLQPGEAEPDPDEDLDLDEVPELVP